jgi:flagellar protein FliO/FliZ
VLELVLRIGFSLLVVFGIMWMLAKVVRRPMAGRTAGTLGVLARQQLSRGASVAVLRVADRALIIGVTETSVTLLGESDVASLERPREEPAAHREPLALEPAASGLTGKAPALEGSVLSPRMWLQTVQFLRDRTARR